jgi:mono/diheme cytochrome c family protein
MLNQKKNRNRSNSHFARCLNLAIGLGVFAVFLIPACVHEPILPVDPGGNTGDTVIVDPVDEPCLPDVVYFERDILPILRSNCAKSGCHDAISHQDGNVFDSYQNVMASDEVDPFDPGGSDLYEVITDNDPDDRMPPPPNQRLTQEQIAMIRKWIQQGAQNLFCDDPTGECNAENVSYSGFIVPLLTNTCIGCHSGAGASGGVVLNTFNGVKTVADNGRLVGAITWASGYQQMPFGSPTKLQDCQIEKIKAWVNDGAPEN